MINDHTLARFQPLGHRLTKPVYADYSFANLSATLHFLLTGEATGPLLPADCFGGAYPAPRRIVLLFVDSFGWQFWQRWARRFRTTGRVLEDGVLTPISALFPSTTAASVSTLNFGVLPARHGVYEWNMYVPSYGMTIQTLPFMTLGRDSVSCLQAGHDIRDMLLVRETMHQRLARHGVKSIQLAHRSYAGSLYNAIASAGAHVVPHATLPEALVHLKEALAATPEKALVNLYWAGLDTSAHLFGPGSPVHDAEVMSFWHTVDALFAEVNSPDTLLMITADHGHVGGRASETIYVNEKLPEINQWLAKGPTDETIWPNGSPRDMFLHIEPTRRSEVLGLLRSKLDGIADVMAMPDAIAAGLFGSEPIGDEIRQRLGDILVLPHLGHFVWWREAGIMENRFHGHHGGLTREEMITVLGVVPWQ